MIIHPTLLYWHFSWFTNSHMRRNDLEDPQNTFVILDRNLYLSKFNGITVTFKVISAQRSRCHLLYMSYYNSDMS